MRYLLAWAPAVEAAKSRLIHRMVPDAVLHAGTVSFLAHSTFGTFAGTTASMTGAIAGAQEYAMTRGWVEAHVATLATGNRRRDRELRAALDIGRTPTMQFRLRGATVVTASLGRHDVTSLLLNGALTLRGITRRVELPATVTRTAATTRVSSLFPVDLADYGVSRLTRLFGLLRVRPRIEVRVNLWFIDRLTTPLDDANAEASPE